MFLGQVTLGGHVDAVGRALAVPGGLPHGPPGGWSLLGVGGPCTANLAAPYFAGDLGSVAPPRPSVRSLEGHPWQPLAWGPCGTVSLEAARTAGAVPPAVPPTVLLDEIEAAGSWRATLTGWRVCCAGP